MLGGRAEVNQNEIKRQGHTRAAGIVSFLVLWSIVIPAAPADAQLDARARPHVRGPLAFVNKICDRRPERAGGRLIATSRSCLRFYAFDPAKEKDSRRNFGVVWMQSNVNARRGWCATRAKSIITFPRRVHVLETTPGGLSTSDARHTQARLRISHATDKPATIQNAFKLYPRRLRTGLDNEGTSFHAAWRGSTQRALGFALGVELSWQANDGPPRFGSILDFALARSRSC